MIGLFVKIIIFTILFISIISIAEANITDFRFVRLVTVESSIDIENYTFRIILPETNTLISQGKMKSDCSDIRVYSIDWRQKNVTNQVRHWMQRDTCNSANTAIWVNTSLRAGTNYFFIAYGNSTVQSASDPSIFPFFDDFNSLANWSVMTGNGTVSVSNGMLVISCPSANNCDWWGGALEYAPVVWRPMPNFTFEFYVRVHSNTLTPFSHVGPTLFFDRNNAHLFGYMYHTSSSIPPIHYYEIREETIAADVGRGGWFASVSSSTGPYYLVYRYNTTTNSLIGLLYSFNGAAFSSIAPGIPHVTYNKTGLFGKKWTTGAGDLVVQFDYVFIRRFVQDPVVTIYNESRELNSNWNRIIAVLNEANLAVRTLQNVTIELRKFSGHEHYNYTSLTTPAFFTVQMNKDETAFITYISNLILQRGVILEDETIVVLYVVTDDAANMVLLFDDPLAKYANGFIKMSYVTQNETIMTDFRQLNYLSTTVSLARGKSYILTLCTANKDECRSLGYLQWNYLGYATYQIRYPVFSDFNLTYRTPAVKYNILLQNNSIVVEYTTLQGTTYFAKLNIYDDNNSLVFSATHQSQSGRFVFSDMKNYILEFIVNNSYHPVYFKSRTYITIPEKKIIDIDKTAASIFFGGLCIFTVLLFRRSLAPAGMILSLALLVLFIYLDLLEMNYNTITLLAIIAALSFFVWYRERVMIDDS